MLFVDDDLTLLGSVQVQDDDDEDDYEDFYVVPHNQAGVQRQRAPLLNREPLLNIPIEQLPLCPVEGKCVMSNNRPNISTLWKNSQ